MFTTTFWKAAFERAVRTFAQAYAALLVADPVVGAVEFDWLDSAAVSGLAALASLLTSIGAGVLTSSNGPSLSSAEVLNP
ncbi:MAG: holin [Acidimicrobiales bacterium]